jgi:hypothetical protein
VTLDEQWAAIEAAIPEVLEDCVAMLRDGTLLMALAKERFYACAESFGDLWLSRDLDWFSANAAEEAADLIVYLAMERARVTMDDRPSE